MNCLAVGALLFMVGISHSDYDSELKNNNRMVENAPR